MMERIDKGNKIIEVVFVVNLFYFDVVYEV